MTLDEQIAKIREDVAFIRGRMETLDDTLEEFDAVRREVSSLSATMRLGKWLLIFAVTTLVTYMVT